METPTSLTEARIAILGLGLMGGSLAMALQGHCESLSGADPDPETVALARQRKIVDRCSTDPGDILPDSNVIVLAAPVGVIPELIHDLPGLHPGKAIVLDFGSTKAEIVQAMETLPPRFDPLGGHPMCGKEKLSLANADPGIFRGAPFAFTPLERTSPQARAFVEQLALTIGAHPLWLDPLTHDRWTASTSHLPYLLSVALAWATPPESAPLIGPGFRSATRLAATPASMMLDVLITNRANLQQALAQLRRQLDDVEQILAEGDDVSLQAWLEQGAELQRELVESSGLQEHP